MTVGTSVRGTVLMIVAEKMTSKTLSQRASRGWVKDVGVRENSSGRREDMSAIRELDVLGCIMRDGEGMVFFVHVIIV